MSAATVYRAYDENNTLLYVGCTTMRVEQRMQAHSSVALWRSRIARWTEVSYDTHKAALDAERDAIQTEFPRWNLRDRSPDHPDGPLMSLLQIALRHPEDVTRPSPGYAAFEYDARIAPILNGWGWRPDRAMSYARARECFDNFSSGRECRRLDCRED
jgi:predicted GIY-YIG superfamily endonuclease